jgi:hypothetical protein
LGGFVSGKVGARLQRRYLGGWRAEGERDCVFGHVRCLNALLAVREWERPLRECAFVALAFWLRLLIKAQKEFDSFLGQARAESTIAVRVRLSDGIAGSGLSLIFLEEFRKEHPLFGAR